MSDTPRTDKLSTFLVTQFPATLGNLELDKHLCELERCERELNEAKQANTNANAAIGDMANECQKFSVNLYQWKAMAQELLNLVICTCSGQCEQTESGHYTSCHRYKALSRFNALNKP